MSEQPKKIGMLKRLNAAFKAFRKNNALESLGIYGGGTSVLNQYVDPLIHNKYHDVLNPWHREFVATVDPHAAKICTVLPQIFFCKPLKFFATPDPIFMNQEILQGLGLWLSATGLQEVLQIAAEQCYIHGWAVIYAFAAPNTSLGYDFEIFSECQLKPIDMLRDKRNAIVQYHIDYTPLIKGRDFIRYNLNPVRFELTPQNPGILHVEYPYANYGFGLAPLIQLWDPLTKLREERHSNSIRKRIYPWVRYPRGYRKEDVDKLMEDLSMWDHANAMATPSEPDNTGKDSGLPAMQFMTPAASAPSLSAGSGSVFGNVSDEWMSLTDYTGFSIRWFVGDPGGAQAGAKVDQNDDDMNEIRWFNVLQNTLIIPFLQLLSSLGILQQAGFQLTDAEGALIPFSVRTWKEYEFFATQNYSMQNAMMQDAAGQLIAQNQTSKQKQNALDFWNPNEAALIAEGIERENVRGRPAMKFPFGNPLEQPGQFEQELAGGNQERFLAKHRGAGLRILEQRQQQVLDEFTRFLMANQPQRPQQAGAPVQPQPRQEEFFAAAQAQEAEVPGSVSTPLPSQAELPAAEEDPFTEEIEEEFDMEEAEATFTIPTPQPAPIQSAPVEVNRTQIVAQQGADQPLQTTSAESVAATEEPGLENQPFGADVSEQSSTMENYSIVPDSTGNFADVVVEFKSYPGQYYTYPKVPISVAQGLVGASSHGKYIWDYFRGRTPGRSYPLEPRQGKIVPGGTSGSIRDYYISRNVPLQTPQGALVTPFTQAGQQGNIQGAVAAPAKGTSAQQLQTESQDFQAAQTAYSQQYQATGQTPTQPQGGSAPTPAQMQVAQELEQLLNRNNGIRLNSADIATKIPLPLRSNAKNLIRNNALNFTANAFHSGYGLWYPEENSLEYVCPREIPKLVGQKVPFGIYHNLEKANGLDIPAWQQVGWYHITGSDEKDDGIVEVANIELDEAMVNHVFSLLNEQDWLTPKIRANETFEISAAYACDVIENAQGKRLQTNIRLASVSAVPRGRCPTGFCNVSKN